MIDENYLRVDLTPLDRAKGHQRYLDKGRSVKGICERLNLKPEYVRN